MPCLWHLLLKLVLVMRSDGVGDSPLEHKLHCHAHISMTHLQHLVEVGHCHPREAAVQPVCRGLASDVHCCALVKLELLAMALG